MVNQETRPVVLRDARNETLGDEHPIRRAFVVT